MSDLLVRAAISFVSLDLENERISLSCNLQTGGGDEGLSFSFPFFPETLDCALGACWMLANRLWPVYIDKGRGSIWFGGSTKGCKRLAAEIRHNGSINAWGFVYQNGFSMQRSDFPNIMQAITTSLSLPIYREELELFRRAAEGEPRNLLAVEYRKSISRQTQSERIKIQKKEDLLSEYAGEIF